MLLRPHQPSVRASEPCFDEIVPVIAQVLDSEGALLEHALHHGYSLQSDSDWLRVCMAGGWTVVQRYAQAVARGEWPSL